MRNLIPSFLIHFITPLIVVLLCLLGLVWVDVWQYSRVAVEQGQWWGLISGHFAHGNVAHTVMNSLGLLLATLLAPVWMNRWPGLPLLLVMNFLLGVAIYVVEPDVAVYRGLSGTLHGWVLLAVILSPQFRPLWKWFMVLLIVGKVGWEQWVGHSSSTPIYLGNLEGTVLTEAHAYGAMIGAIIGTLVALSAWLFPHLRRLGLRQESLRRIR
ncbi:MAG: rhombosortase [Natronospirillum sp.]